MNRLGRANMRPIARKRSGGRIYCTLDFLATNTFCFGNPGLTHRECESAWLTDLAGAGTRLVRFHGVLAMESEALPGYPDSLLQKQAACTDLQAAGGWPRD